MNLQVEIRNRDFGIKRETESDPVVARCAVLGEESAHAEPAILAHAKFRARVECAAWRTWHQARRTARTVAGRAARFTGLLCRLVLILPRPAVRTCLWSCAALTRCAGGARCSTWDIAVLSFSACLAIKQCKQTLLGDNVLLQGGGRFSQARH